SAQYPEGWAPNRTMDHIRPQPQEAKPRGSRRSAGGIATLISVATVETSPSPSVSSDFVLSLSESAAVKVKELMAQEPSGEAEVLRVAIRGGGCSGFEYALGFDPGPGGGDPRSGGHRDTG